MRESIYKKCIGQPRSVEIKICKGAIAWMSISSDFEADLSMRAGYYEVEAIFVSLRTERIKIHLQIIRGG